MENWQVLLLTTFVNYDVLKWARWVGEKKLVAVSNPAAVGRVTVFANVLMIGDPVAMRPCKEKLWLASLEHVTPWKGGK